MAGRAKTALTQRAVDSASGTGKPYAVGDAACAGLRLWVGKAGTKRWQLCRDGKTTILGDATTIPLAEARQLASGPVAAVKAAVSLRTIGDYVTRYLATEAAHLAKSTRRPQMVRQFLAELLNRPLAELTREWVIARQNELLAAGYKGSSVVTYPKAAAIFAGWLVEHEHIARTPFRKLPTVPVNESFYFLDDRGKAGLEAACARYPDPGIASLVMICLCCGLRKGEVLALEWTDFNFARKRLTVRAETTKTKRGRVVPMPESLMGFISSRTAVLPAKRPFGAKSVDWRWDKLRTFAALGQHITIHGLRHSYATTLLRRGENIKVISTLLGHRSIEITMRYLHALDSELFAAAAKIDDNPRPYLPAAHLRGSEPE